MNTSGTVRIFIAFIILLTSVVLLPIGSAGADRRLSRGETVYVPVYSHIYSGNREQPFYLAITLSIRNTDMKHPICLTAVDYFDSEGKFLTHYLDKSLILKPMATKRYVVPESDKSGGSGAKFIVKWQSDQLMAPPLIESVMISTKTQQGSSLTSRGRVLEAISK
jgi:hypothetical protein